MLDRPTILAYVFGAASFLLGFVILLGPLGVIIPGEETEVQKDLYYVASCFIYAGVALLALGILIPHKWRWARFKEGLQTTTIVGGLVVGIGAGIGVLILFGNFLAGLSTTTAVLLLIFLALAGGKGR